MVRLAVRQLISGLPSFKGLIKELIIELYMDSALLQPRAGMFLTWLSKALKRSHSVMDKSPGTSELHVTVFFIHQTSDLKGS